MDALQSCKPKNCIQINTKIICKVNVWTLMRKFSFSKSVGQFSSCKLFIKVLLFKFFKTGVKFLIKVASNDSIKSFWLWKSHFLFLASGRIQWKMDRISLWRLWDYIVGMFDQEFWARFGEFEIKYPMKYSKTLQTRTEESKNLQIDFGKNYVRR